MRDHNPEPFPLTKNNLAAIQNANYFIARRAVPIYLQELCSTLDIHTTVCNNYTHLAALD